MTYDPDAEPTVPLKEFIVWFYAQKFTARDKGRYGEIIDRVKKLPDISAGKAFIEERIRNRDRTDRLRAFLNETP